MNGKINSNLIIRDAQLSYAKKLVEDTKADLHTHQGCSKPVQDKFVQTSSDDLKVDINYRGHACLHSRVPEDLSQGRHHKTFVENRQRAESLQGLLPHVQCKLPGQSAWLFPLGRTLRFRSKGRRAGGWDGPAQEEIYPDDPAAL